MRIKASPGTVALSRQIGNEVVRVEFDKNGEAEVDDNIGRAFCKQLKGVNEVKPLKEVESE